MFPRRFPLAARSSFPGATTGAGFVFSWRCRADDEHRAGKGGGFKLGPCVEPVGFRQGVKPGAAALGACLVGHGRSIFKDERNVGADRRPWVASAGDVNRLIVG